MTERDLLIQALRGEPGGFTRTELAHRLRLPDRAVRKLIEEVVAEGEWPVLADRTAGGEARYRIAQAHEYDAVNAANREDKARAISLHQKARGRYQAFARRYQTGSLFLEPVSDT
jgi:predicted ArsR family transcriptional regulator